MIDESFRYDAARAAWREVAQGSALEGGQYGVPDRVQDHLPTCIQTRPAGGQACQVPPMPDVLTPSTR
jgi:hypothetical protein